MLQNSPELCGTILSHNWLEPELAFANDSSHSADSCWTRYPFKPWVFFSHDLLLSQASPILKYIHIYICVCTQINIHLFTLNLKIYIFFIYYFPMLINFRIFPNISRRTDWIRHKTALSSQNWALGLLFLTSLLPVKGPADLYLWRHVTPSVQQCLPSSQTLCTAGVAQYLSDWLCVCLKEHKLVSPLENER